MTDTCRIHVPATCAHLGPGFGVLGLALDRGFNYAVASREDDSVLVTRPTDRPLPLGKRHDGVVVGVRAARQHWEADDRTGFDVGISHTAPARRGLGSFTADVVAGVRIVARRHETPPSLDEQLKVIVSAGADPAHAAAALRGGLAIAMTHGQDDACIRSQLHDAWRIVVVVPELRVPSAETHRSIPATMLTSVVARTAGRVAGLIQALQTGDEQLLGSCLQDEVHVPHRLKLVPEVREAIDAAQGAGAAGATISGHGPSVVAFTTDDSKTAAICSAATEAFERSSTPCSAFVCGAGEAADEITEA